MNVLATVHTLCEHETDFIYEIKNWIYKIHKGAKMRYMGLDVGDRTVGIAISDPFMMTAQGHDNYRRVENANDDIKYLLSLIKEYEVSKIIVGLPLNMNGSEGPQVEKTREFIKKLSKKLNYSTDFKDKNIEVVFWDERLSSMQAEKFLISADVSRAKRKKVIDKMASVYILQSYLDMERIRANSSN